jgi:hypothetical protein
MKNTKRGFFPDTDKGELSALLWASVAIGLLILLYSLIPAEPLEFQGIKNFFFEFENYLVSLKTLR